MWLAYKTGLPTKQAFQNHSTGTIQLPFPAERSQLGCGNPTLSSLPYLRQTKQAAQEKALTTA